MAEITDKLDEAIMKSKASQRRNVIKLGTKAFYELLKAEPSVKDDWVYYGYNVLLDINIPDDEIRII